MATTAESLLSLELSEKETKVLVGVCMEGAAAKLMVLEMGVLSGQEARSLAQEVEVTMDILERIADSLEAGAEGKPAYVPKPDLLLFQSRK